MSKIFFDVFPTLKVNEEIRMLFESVQVEKVSTNRQRDFINVFLFSDHLIQKRHIYSMEGMIKDQLFARVPVRVTIFEHFQLSEQYTPENLMREYYDSLMLEAAQRSVVESNMLKTAEYTVKNDKTICLKLKDTVIAHGKQESIVSLIRNVFEERFHVPVEIQVEYEEVKDSKLKFNESRLQQEVNAIMERNHALHEERAEQEKEKEEKAEKKEKTTIDKPKEKEAKQQKQFAGTGNNSSGGNSQKWRGGGRSGSFSYRKSDDPNMIFANAPKLTRLWRDHDGRRVARPDNDMRLGRTAQPAS